MIVGAYIEIRSLPYKVCLVGIEEDHYERVESCLSFIHSQNRSSLKPGYISFIHASKICCLVDMVNKHNNRKIISAFKSYIREADIYRYGLDHALLIHLKNLRRCILYPPVIDVSSNATLKLSHPYFNFIDKSLNLQAHTLLACGLIQNLSYLEKR